MTDTEDSDQRGESEAPCDALVMTALGVFPDARVLSPREQILHYRPTQCGLSRPSWHLSAIYGIWAIPWGGFRDGNLRSLRGTASRAVRRRSPARRTGRPR